MRPPTPQEYEMAKAIINVLQTLATNKDIQKVAELIARARNAAYQQGKVDCAATHPEAK